MALSYDMRTAIVVLVVSLMGAGLAIGAVAFFEERARERQRGWRPGE